MAEHNSIDCRIARGTRRTMIKVFHTTFHSKEILEEGFRDAAGRYLTSAEYVGVWVADRPLDINEGADGDVVLCLEIPGETFQAYEWVEECKPYREALIPAAILNGYGPPIVCDSEGGAQ